MARVTTKQAMDHIESGLSAKRRTAANPLTSLQGIGSLLTLTNLNDFGALAASKHGHVIQHLDGIAAAFKLYQETELPLREADLKNLPISRDERNAHLKKLAEQKRRELIEIAPLAADRARLRAELREQAQKAAAVRALWSDPVSVMVRANGSTEKAQRWRDALAASGPVEVRSMLETAIATADHALAIGAFARLDAMSPEDRKHVGISKKDCATLLVGEACERAKLVCDAVVYLSDRAESRAREVAGEPVPSDTKIELGARAKILAPFFDPPKTEEPQS